MNRHAILKRRFAMRSVLLGLAFMAASIVGILSAKADITVHKRSRVESGNSFAVKEMSETWQPGQTAIIVCDMWDSHHCLNAVRRCVEIAPRMNEVLKKARDQGVLIVHAPSSCMAPYESTPMRQRAKNAPRAANLPKDIASWCNKIPSEEKGKYPINQSDGGEDDEPAEHAAW